MKRKIVTFLLLFSAVFLQCSFFQSLEIASIKPNLLMIVVVSIGLMRGRTSGLYAGFTGGLMMDLFFPGIIGFNALVYMWLGYAAGCFYRIFYDDDIKTPILLVSAADFIYGTVWYAFSFLLRGRTAYFFYLGRIIIPEILYTLILTMLTYWIPYRINKWLARTDKRSLDDFA